VSKEIVQGHSILIGRRRFGRSDTVTILEYAQFSQIDKLQEITVSLFVSDVPNIADWSGRVHHMTSLGWLGGEVEKLSRHKLQSQLPELTHSSLTSAVEAMNLEHTKDFCGFRVRL
jgi:hypothetical protein